MRLLDRLVRRTGYWEGLASGAAILTSTYGSPDREAILPQVAGWAQQANGSDAVVFAAILARMHLFSEARFVFQRASDKGVFGDASLAKLERPFGPRSHAGELLARMEQDASIAGNSYTWDAGDRLVRLRPDWVTIVSELVHPPGGGTYRQVIGYWWEPPKSVLDQGKGEFYPADEVAHWAPIPDPQADFRGMSWLTPVYRDINADSGLAQYKIKYLENNASPNVVIRYAQKLHPSVIDSVRERMHARYGGVENAFKTLVLDQGADLTVVGNSMQQMDFANVVQAGTDRILSAALVPPLVVGLEPIRGAGKSYEQVMRHFGELWGLPQWRSACAALEPLLDFAPLGKGGVRLWIAQGEIAALQDGAQVQAQVALVSAQAVLTYVQAGATIESAMAAVEAGDVSLLVRDTAAALAPAAPTNVQHLLPQAQPGATADPLPPMLPRLPAGSVSPGDGGNGTRPTRRPSAGRRSITTGVNGHG